MITHRPCGACRALVSADGCEHWRPKIQVAGSKSQRVRVKAQKRLQRVRDQRAIEEFRRQQGLNAAADAAATARYKQQIPPTGVGLGSDSSAIVEG